MAHHIIEQSAGRVVIGRDREGGFRWRLEINDEGVVATSERHETQHGALRSWGFLALVLTRSTEWSSSRAEIDVSLTGGYLDEV